MSWDSKNMFVCSTVVIKSTNQKTVKGDGMRQRKSPSDRKCLYTSRLEITRDKWTDLQYMMKFIPSDTHEFYDTIPSEEESRRQVARKCAKILSM
ncbi:hypothetical protein AVEN_211466-1 [Araneus ventricosus]|uniref:Uncharacterized protein n=1 Tax=Araneus ventricosus TaxID=182803 RepID=A0A4Y2HTK9_ARAVE|nr:hypothetical protein AVEN_264471-1 [Araneus ventricosus]GBM68553.1 hypothetical protein AVEN_211466-1 [Araneus ventricosus]